jgi:hypothetical protein
MGGVYKRDDWNDIIRRINELSANPPEGQDALPALDEVPEGHKWSVADIEQVRSHLQMICADNIFSAQTVSWTRDIITEIEQAIANGWCGEEWIDYPEDIKIEVYRPAPYDVVAYLEPPWNCTPEEAAACAAGATAAPPTTYTSADALIGGLQIARPGILGRTWRLVLANTFNGGATVVEWTIQSGPIACDGTVQDASHVANIPDNFWRVTYYRYCRDHICQSGGHSEPVHDSMVYSLRLHSRGGSTCRP